MGTVETIKTLMIKEGIKQNELNNILNEKNGTNYTRNNLSKKINSSSIKYTDYKDILDCLGYEIQIVKKV